MSGTKFVSYNGTQDDLDYDYLWVYKQPAEPSIKLEIFNDTTFSLAKADVPAFIAAIASAAGLTGEWVQAEELAELRATADWAEGK